MPLPVDVIADLGTSRLDPEDMRIREAAAPEMASVGAPTASEGYVIPYFDIRGKPLAFYRVRILNGTPKYRQPKESPNYAYIPPNFLASLDKMLSDTTLKHKFVIITEGEKKAAAAVKTGFPTIAVSGVDSWRNRSILFPVDTQIQTTPGPAKQVRLYVPPGTNTYIEDFTLAIGLADIVRLIHHHKLNTVIIYDTDLATPTWKPQVQRAAAVLAFELRHQGLPFNQIRQVILPNSLGIKLVSNDTDIKVGLDDFLAKHRSNDLLKLIYEAIENRKAFPRHPNPWSYIAGKLQRSRLSRSETQAISTAVLSELDARGSRMIADTTKEQYFFDEDTRKLIPVHLLHRSESYHETPFGQLLYEQFGLIASDQRVLNWLASQFVSEKPIDSVEPRRVITTHTDRPDCVAYQAGDGEFFLITPDPNEPIKLMSNGSEGVLFEQGHVEQLDADDVLNKFKKLSSKSLEPWWLNILQGVSITNQQSETNAREMMALTFYLSPWLNRWRGTQLPIELVIGEAGSGKSSLYSLRLEMLTGQPYLRNSPADLRDWHASITSTGGLHVIDNVKFTNKDLRQRVSDEICRIITEPFPHVEMRKLYTNASLLRAPVDTIFAYTAIQQPFFNADLIQRSIILETQAITEQHDGNWVAHQLSRYGGRENWVAHHLLVIHKFLEACVHGGAWDPEYEAAHRLTHYEQCLMILAEVLGMKSDWIAEALVLSSQRTMSEADWALDGLKNFAISSLKTHKEGKRFTAAEISSWAAAEEDYMDNQQLTNARRLGRYIQAHKHTISVVTGITEAESMYGKRSFTVKKRN